MRWRCPFCDRENGRVLPGAGGCWWHQIKLTESDRLDDRLKDWPAESYEACG